MTTFYTYPEPTPTTAGANVALHNPRSIPAPTPLAAEYYRLTSKPLGVTGEVAEYVAAELLGLALAPARTAGYDAVRQTPHGEERHGLPRFSNQDLQNFRNIFSGFFGTISSSPSQFRNSCSRW